MLNVAIIGSVFAVFSLIYNDYYIYYGLITAGYGVFAHVVFKLIENKIDEKNKWGWLSAASNIIITIIWILVLVKIY